jgi:P pilus assembly chaperone PapD
VLAAVMALAAQTATWRMARPALLGAAVIALAAWPAPAHAQLAVDSMIVTLAAADGAAARTVAVRNEGIAAADVEVLVQDWEVGADGAHRFLPRGTLADSCAERLAVERTAFRLEAGAVIGVRLTYAGAAGDRCRGIVFFRVTQRPSVLEGDHLIIGTGVKVYVEP